MSCLVPCRQGIDYRGHIPWIQNSTPHDGLRVKWMPWIALKGDHNTLIPGIISLYPYVELSDLGQCDWRGPRMGSLLRRVGCWKEKYSHESNCKKVPSFGRAATDSSWRRRIVRERRRIVRQRRRIVREWVSTYMELQHLQLPHHLAPTGMAQPVCHLKGGKSKLKTQYQKHQTHFTYSNTVRLICKWKKKKRKKNYLHHLIQCSLGSPHFVHLPPPCGSGSEKKKKKNLHMAVMAVKTNESKYSAAQQQQNPVHIFLQCGVG